MSWLLPKSPDASPPLAQPERLLRRRARSSAHVRASDVDCAITSAAFSDPRLDSFSSIERTTSSSAWRGFGEVTPATAGGRPEITRSST